jgi:hypothetical protein
MRSDMAKVLVERPRGGRGVPVGKGYRKELQRTPIEETRTREGIKARCRNNPKWFSDHLGPLRRFLLSQVGRPWDLVYSEICQGVRKGFPVREHFLLHVYQYVERAVILVGNIPCHGEGRVYGTPLSNYSGQYLYVCPKSGLLKRVPERRKSRR